MRYSIAALITLAASVAAAPAMSWAPSPQPGPRAPIEQVRSFLHARFVASARSQCLAPPLLAADVEPFWLYDPCCQRVVRCARVPAVKAEVIAEAPEIIYGEQVRPFNDLLLVDQPIAEKEAFAYADVTTAMLATALVAYEVARGVSKRV